ncbi:MAG: DNA-3-methyladenine glycosylase [Bacillota bacterium]
MTYLTRDQQHQITCDQVLNLPRLDRQFYSARALDVAPRLLGMVLARVTSEGVTAGRIIETEAYEAPEDRACHAFGGRRTRRTEVMYGPPGHAYVYFTYGMHWMLNVVAAAEGTPHAVLIRSIEPICGLSLMAKRRRGMLPLAEGPARLCQALGITGADNGVDLVGMPGMAKMARIAGMPGTAGTPGIAGMPSSTIFIARPPDTIDPSPEYLVTKRVGVGNSGGAKHYPWRFVVKGTAPAKMKVEYPAES